MNKRYHQEWLEKGAVVSSDVFVPEGTQIGLGTQIGSGCIIGSPVVIGNHVRIGRGVHIGSNVFIADNCIIGNYTDECTTDTKYEASKGFGRIVLEDGVQIMPGCFIEVPLDAEGATRIGEYSHLGFNTYVKEQAHIGIHTTIAAYCLIGEHAEIEGHCFLGNYTTVGAYTYLKSGCDAVNHALFENRRTYEAGWHGSLLPARDQKVYAKELRKARYG